MSEPLGVMYQCQGCFGFYDDLREADMCCPPYEHRTCATCDSPYADSDQAKECCTND